MSDENPTNLPPQQAVASPAAGSGLVEHTPGPWQQLKYPDVKTWTVAATQSVASKIRTEADARLIAAAPDLLSVLLRLVKLADDNPHCPAGLAIEHCEPSARAAISKATTGQNAERSNPAAKPQQTKDHD